MLWVTGRRTNLWAEGQGLTASSTNPRLPAPNLANDDPNVPVAADDATSPWDLVLDARLAPFTDPHFDSAWTLAPEGWQHVGDGSLDRDTGIVSSGGGASCRFNNHDGPSYIVAEGEVACGQILDVSAQFQGGYPELAGYILCLDTGLYWSVDEGGWVLTEQAALQYAAGDTPGDVYTKVQAPGVQIPNLTDRDVVRVRIVLGVGGGAGGDAWIDDVRILARASIWSLHHPRNCQGATFLLEASDDAVDGAWTTVATLSGMTTRLDAYQTFVARSARRWRLRTRWIKPLDHVLPAAWGFPGPPAIGESVLALAFKAAGTWSKRTDAWDVPQVRAGQAARHRIATAGGPARRVTLEREGASLTTIGNALNRLFWPSLGGVRNTLLVWNESIPTAVVFGALDQEWAWTEEVRQPNYPHRLSIAGYPPAIWTD